jgi:PTH1 family peptidyl-tRNA hydrolase
MSDKYLIVGLGNPGPRYRHNRHNVGFQVIDHLAARHGLTFTRRQSNAMVAAGRIAGRAVVLAKPRKFMNLSGEPVAQLRRFYQVERSSLLVVFDDLDLPVGTIRLRPAGGAGGQKGMKSIISHLGEEFPRLRVGIGRPPGRMDPADYVLHDFTKEELPLLRETLDRAASAIETWLSDGIELAMSRYNGPASE